MESFKPELSSILQLPDFTEFLMRMKFSVEKFINLADDICAHSKMQTTTIFIDELAKASIGNKPSLHHKAVISELNEYFIRNNKVMSKSSDYSTSGIINSQLSTAGETNCSSQIKFKVVKGNKCGSNRFSLRADCIRKKLRRIFHRYLTTTLNKIGSRENLKFKPLPKLLNVSLNQKFNKQWINMPLKDLLTCPSLFETEKDKADQNHNMQCLNKVISPILNEFLKKEWLDHFNHYLVSNEFNRMINNLEQVSQTYAEKMKISALDLPNFLERQ